MPDITCRDCYSAGFEGVTLCKLHGAAREMREWIADVGEGCYAFMSEQLLEDARALVAKTQDSTRTVTPGDEYAAAHQASGGDGFGRDA